ncbi:site-2 protease family protein [Candidatus Saccharibacteria bacterium]|nr:site-2 protease family protein [Candidatus Saccharibacteria bacterium]
MNLLGGVIVLGVIVVSMALHELAHGYVAYLLGDTTAKEDGRLTLNPLQHLDPVMSVILPMISFFLGGVVFGGAKPVPVNSRRLRGGVWGMALVALAGPLTNFLIALVALALGTKVPALSYGWSAQVLSQFVVVNLGFGVFNLIPIPPLDGSRVLYALMPDGVRELMDRMEGAGIAIIYILILLGGGIFTSMMTGAIAKVLELFYWILGV